MTENKTTKKQETSQKVSDRVSDDDVLLNRETLIEWEAYERPFRPLNKEVFSTVIAGVFFFGVILFFIEGLIPVMMLVALVFWWYVMGTVTPEKDVYRFTSWGLESKEKLWVWDYMARFWFEGKGSTRVVVIEMLTSFPRHVRVVIDSDETENAVRELLSELIIEDEPKANWLDKASRWLETRIKWSVR